MSGMAAQEDRADTRLSHGCLVRLGLRPDSFSCAPDDEAKTTQGISPRHRWVCEVGRQCDCTSFMQTLRVWLKTHIKSPGDKMATTSGGGSSCERDCANYRIYRQSDSCQKCRLVCGADSVVPSSSMHICSFGNCYGPTKRVTCPTTNQRCSTTNLIARNPTVVAQRRPGRQNKAFGQNLVIRTGSGGSSFEMRAVLVVVAMVVGSCHSFPTQPPLSSSSPSRATQTAQHPLRKGMEGSLIFTLI